MDACDVLVDCGFTKPLVQLSLDDVSVLTKRTSLHCTLLRVKSELDQFMGGLHEAGVLDAMQKILRPLFVASV